jgi:hypothetical protein
MMKKSIYIAGPMSGYPMFNRPAFNLEAYRLDGLGYAVINPATLPDGLSQTQYMSICIPMVIAADEVRILSGWQKSPGAIAEHALAEKLGKVISYQNED